MSGNAADPKRLYMVATVQVALVTEVETLDMERLLDKYREEGSAKLLSAEVRELTDTEAGQLMAQMSK